jgi:HK97 family phage major capsid protein
MRRNALHRALFDRKNDPADGGAGGGSNPALIEVKRLFDEQGKRWEEFKKTNDEIIAKKAEGKAVAELEEKLAKIDTDMTRFEEVKSELDKITARLNRKGLNDAAGGEVDLATEVKSFNISRRAFSSQHVDRDLTVDEYKDYKSAFFKFARSGKLESLESNERKAMSAGDDANGGYLLPTPTVGRVVQKLFELSPIRQLASVVNISTQALEGIYDNDEASVGYVGETAPRPNTNTPVLGKYRIEAWEQYANPKITQTLIDDAAIDVEAWLADKISNKFARFEGSEFINGTGVNHIRGFNQYPFASGTGAGADDTSRPWGTIQDIKTGVNGDFAVTLPADILFDLIQAFKSYYLNGASFATTREVIAKIRKFKEATTNAYMWQPGLAKGTPDTLLGYPIVNAQDLPKLSSNDHSLWLANWKEAYTIVDRQGMRTLRDNLTDKPNVQFYTTRRTGGGVLNFEAIKAVKFST